MSLLKRVEAERLAFIASLADIRQIRRDLIRGRYRVWSVTSFSHLINYNPERMPPRIVRVIHTSCDLHAALADLRD